MKISEIIVVEGKNDIFKVKRAVDADVISVSGQGINKEMIEYLKTLEKKRGIIVLMDPDGPGEKIRAIITNHIPKAKHAFISKDKALLNGDVGVENASIKSIKDSLKNLLTTGQIEGDLIMQDLLTYKLVATDNSRILRKKLSQYLKFGECNGKTLLKRLNMLNITKDKLENLMVKING